MPRNGDERDGTGELYLPGFAQPPLTNGDWGITWLRGEGGVACPFPRWATERGPTQQKNIQPIGGVHMKKIVSLILMIAIAGVFAAGCSGGADSGGGDNTSSSSSSQTDGGEGG